MLKTECMCLLQTVFVSTLICVCAFTHTTTTCPTMCGMTGGMPMSVFQEIVAAIQSRLNIVPILDDFHYPPAGTLPKDMRSICSLSGVRLALTIFYLYFGDASVYICVCVCLI